MALGPTILCLMDPFQLPFHVLRLMKYALKCAFHESKHVAYRMPARPYREAKLFGQWTISTEEGVLQGSTGWEPSADPNQIWTTNVVYETSLQNGNHGDRSGGYASPKWRSCSFRPQIDRLVRASN